MARFSVCKQGRLASLPEALRGATWRSHETSGGAVTEGGFVSP